MTPPGYPNTTSTPWRSSASQTTSAPIRVRVRGLTSRSISLRARSTSAAAAVPAAGTWRPAVAGTRAGEPPRVAVGAAVASSVRAGRPGGPPRVVGVEPFAGTSPSAAVAVPAFGPPVSLAAGSRSPDRSRDPFSVVMRPSPCPGLLALRTSSVASRQTKDPRLPARVLSVRRYAAASGVLPPSPSRLPPGAGNEGDELEHDALELRKEGYVGSVGQLDRDTPTVGRDGDGAVGAGPIELAHEPSILHDAGDRPRTVHDRSRPVQSRCSSRPRYPLVGAPVARAGL